MYSKKISDDHHQVDIYHLESDELHNIMTLSRPGAPYQSYSIFVCSHKTTSWLAVVSSLLPYSLDIYDSSYTHQRHKELPFESMWTSVVAIDDVLIIASKTGLHMYNWAGEELHEFSIEGFHQKWL